MFNFRQFVFRDFPKFFAFSAIAREVGVSRDSVRKYIADPGADIKIKFKQHRRSKLDFVPKDQLKTLFEKSGGNSVVCARLLSGTEYGIKIDNALFIAIFYLTILI